MRKAQDRTGSRRGRRLPGWAVYLIVIAASVPVMILAGTMSASSFRSTLMVLACTVFLAFLAALIVYAVKAAARRAAGEHDALKPMSYNEIRASEPGERGRNTTVQRITYYTDDTLRLGPNAPALTWGHVVLALIILFPLGIYYMVRKLIHEKTHRYDNGVKLIVLGAVFLLISLPVMLLILFSGANSTETLIVLEVIPGIYALIGLAALILGFCFKHKGRVVETYMRAIVKDRVTDLDALVKRTGASYAYTVSAIQDLIDSELLKGAYIYHRDREVIVPGISKKIAIPCKNCGGTTVLYANETRECVYCGAEL